MSQEQDSLTPISEPAETKSSGSNIVVTYNAKPGLGWLSIKNFLLNLITLSIYRFWAKTAVRKHIWSCIHINGEPLEYTGRGLELFLGALIIMLAFVPVVGLITWLQVVGLIEWALVVQLVLMLLFFVLIGMAIYRARRYRLSRTLWRGVRGALVGSSFKYSLLYFGSMLLSGMTLGWSNPAMKLELQERITRDMRFGETPFHFKGAAGPLYGRYAIAWFASLALVIVFAVIFGFTAANSGQEIGAQLKNVDKDPKMMMALVASIYGTMFIVAIFFAVIWAFYTAFEMARHASYTFFDNATFRFNATGGSLIMLWLGNLLIMIFSLGIAEPFTVQRTFRYFIDRLDVDGWVDIGQIQQSQARVDKRGEGLLDAFDLDGF